MSRRLWTDKLMSDPRQPALFVVAELPAQPKRRRAGTVKPRSPKEVDIQRLVLDFLRLHPAVARVERTNTGAGKFLGKDGKVSRFMRFGFVGQADITGFMRDGRVLAIEVKTPKTRLAVRPEQKAYLDQVRASGGVAGVAWSIESLLDVFAKCGVGE